jgi:hypothetical protein
MPPAVMSAGTPSAKDMAFCSELSFHGGVAESEQGFKAEAELVRMRQAGLLDLERNEKPPFAVTRVALSPTARNMLAGRQPIGAAGRGAGTREETMPVLDPTQQRRLRCNGFEVARGMISAAVKSELASWHAAGSPGGTAGLETRMLTRISQIDVPFPA